MHRPCEKRGREQRAGAHVDNRRASSCRNSGAHRLLLQPKVCLFGSHSDGFGAGGVALLTMECSGTSRARPASSFAL